MNTKELRDCINKLEERAELDIKHRHYDDEWTLDEVQIRLVDSQQNVATWCLEELGSIPIVELETQRSESR